jgi:hypothetical protein
MSDPPIIGGLSGHACFSALPAIEPPGDARRDRREGTGMVTASIRRISLAAEEESLVDLIPKHVHFLPNTAG